MDSIRHKAASRMLRWLRQQPKVFSALGGAKVWEDVLWVIGALEAAHPQLAPRFGPQLEYPWENARGEVQWPDRDLQVAKAFGDPKRRLAPRLLRFVELLGQNFNGMFP